MIGSARPLPDWRQLSGLRRLACVAMEDIEEPGFEWGAAPLTTLTSLTCVNILASTLPGELGQGAGWFRVGSAVAAVLLPSSPIN